MKGKIMTEQTASTTPEVESTDVVVETPQKRFRFTRKQIAITAAATAATAGLIYLKVKSSASKGLGTTDENSDPADVETDASV
jgi:hypothetical protein